MCSSEDSINSFEQGEKTLEMVEVYRQVLTAPEASARCLDGHVAGVRHE